jgi:3'-phosphoadenosine 5'-phosphosulfate sulfotransferase (PAPS reductase)/FAD synthetase
MDEKKSIAIEFIRNAFANIKGPSVIAWSGGKDSMVMLDLMRNAGVKLPVVFFREPWQPWKYQFQDRIIREYGLECYTWQPVESAFQQNGDEFEVQNAYYFNETGITCPTGITPPVSNQPWVCSLDILNRPKQPPLKAEWVNVWVGHKKCDSDPILGGDAGTRVGIKYNFPQATAIYPLMDWTHEDVWNYIESYDIPFDADRYEKVNGKWSERLDRSKNCDYVHACTACVDSRKTAPKFVHCPKFKTTIENISNKIHWVKPTIPSYMKD